MSKKIKLIIIALVIIGGMFFSIKIYNYIQEKKAFELRIEELKKSKDEANEVLDRLEKEGRVDKKLIEKFRKRLNS